MQPRYHRWQLWIECLLIFIGIPAFLYYSALPVYLLTIPLIIVVIPVFIWLVNNFGLKESVLWVEDRQLEKKYIKFIILRFLVMATLLLLVVLTVFPERLFDLPVSHTPFWVAFVVFYPLLSVYPQELLFRAFFFKRYGVLFTDDRLMLLINALLFCWVHIIFENVTALLYTFVGGILFASTYQKTRSLRLVCLEHSMYGVFLFTIGHGKDLVTRDVLQTILQ